MKTAGIIAAISAFFAKAVKIIRSASRLKKLTKETIEAKEAGEKAFKEILSVINKVKGYFSEDSDGGKKLTAKETKEGMDLLLSLEDSVMSAKKEIFEAGEEYKKLWDSLKS